MRRGAQAFSLSHRVVRADIVFLLEIWQVVERGRIRRQRDMVAVGGRHPVHRQDLVAFEQEALAYHEMRHFLALWVNHHALHVAELFVSSRIDIGTRYNLHWSLLLGLPAAR